MSREKLLFLLSPVTAVVFGGIGWFGKDLQLNGVVGATEPTMFGGLTITGIVALCFSVYSAWKIAGGRFDGKVTPQELASLINAAISRFDPLLDAKLKPLVDGLSVVVAPAVERAIGPAEMAIANIPGGAVTATRLLDWIEAWYKDPKETANESALLNTFLDKLSEMVKEDTDGSLAAATLRARLHAVLNTPKEIAVL